MARELLIGVTEARENFKKLLDEVKDRNIVVLRRNRVAAVLIDPDRLEALLQRIEDLEDTVSVLENRLDSQPRIRHADVVASRELANA